MPFYLWSTGRDCRGGGGVIVSPVLQGRKRKHQEGKTQQIQTSGLQRVVHGSLLHLNHLLLKMQIHGICFNPESETSQMIL